MKSQAVRYTVRGVPGEVDRVLRERAASRHISLNQVIIEELETVTVGKWQIADYSSLVGILGPDPEFDAILESGRQIDTDMWT